MNIVILGLSITSSWGNGHATTYRSLVRGLAERGHRSLFLERDVPWYAANRDLPKPSYGRTELYCSVTDLKRRFSSDIRQADAIIVGSYVPDAVPLGLWITGLAQGITAFYDIDTPVTLAKLERGDHEYLTPSLIPRYDLYLSFTGGPLLDKLRRDYGARQAHALYCSVDPDLYFLESVEYQHDLGYLGTYSADRQPALDRLLLAAAGMWDSGRFIVAGPMYPPEIAWPSNVTRIEHLPPAAHRRFYNSQRFTLNLTRADMIAAGYSPSVRLFEAAACGTPIISDAWPGLDTLFTPGKEIFVANTPRQVLSLLRTMPEKQRIEAARRARQRVLAAHTGTRRAAELERYLSGIAAPTTAGAATAAFELGK